MQNLSPTLYEEVRSALSAAGRNDLVTRLDAARREPENLTSTQAAELLGVSSPNTVKNWLQGGHFPGAFRTNGGHWRFPRAEVVAVKERMNELRMRNRRGEIGPNDNDGNDDPPPLL